MFIWFFLWNSCCQICQYWPFSGGSRNFKTGSAVPARCNSWGFGIVFMSFHIHPFLEARVENKLHIVDNVCCLLLKNTHIIQSKFTKTISKKIALCVSPGSTFALSTFGSWNLSLIQSDWAQVNKAVNL